MTLVDGRYVSDTVEDILDAMLIDARQNFGDDLNDGQLSVLRRFYLPVAERLAEAQDDVGLVLSSVQIDNAQGAALDLLTALIGVRRQEARRATGEVVFSRQTPGSVDYVVPRGTVVTTENIFDPVRFRTTVTATLSAGDTEVTVPVEAEEGGVDGNLGGNALVKMTRAPSGIETVTNTDHTSGGTERETDDELRERAKDELADGAKATAAALVAGAKGIEGVASVNIFINDTNVDESESGGLPDHSFELVIEGGEDQDLAQFILETKAAGDTSYAGAYGNPVISSGRLSNGQEFDISFSRPSLVQIYVSLDLKVKDDYEGDEAVQDAIVNYLGGLLSTGNNSGGKLGVGDEVLIGEIKYAIRGVRGVYDINDIKVDVVSPPQGTANIPIETNEMATADALDGSISITTEEI